MGHSQPLNDAIAAVKQSENATKLIKALLTAQQEQWKEQLIHAQGNDIAKLQGAIAHTRTLADALSENQFETTLHTQSYT